ncbi:hypothetical protein [Streptomyces sp. CB03238]|uniref:hypothetical protein n=1 Tax=Streptomyces sp. CB03238 TaxID=1907777 RepID=UPI000A108C03|nr:hypothetical protein [Streptomyces sp. CB03238]ORT60535.1 hypothetical protein BKD26_09235 [Streptomyces sp. CB03238]
MPDDGLEYLPDGLREGGRGSYLCADEADEAQQRLRSIRADASSWGGAEEFVGSVNETRDVQAGGVQRAAEERELMGRGAHRSAGIGEATDADASAAVTQRGAPGQEASAPARIVADGM